MGNFLTRAAKLPKAAVLSAFVIAFSIIGLSVTTQTASADGIEGSSGGGGSVFHVKLTGSSNPGQYTVTAIHTSDNKSIPLKNTGGADFYSDYFAVGNASGCVAGTGATDTSANFNYTITASVNGKTANSKTVNYCGQNAETAILGVTLGVTDGQTNVPGTASGTIAYVDKNDNVVKPFGSSSSMTLVSGGTRINLSVGNDGKFTATNLTPGTYKLAGHYNAPNGTTYTIPDTEVVIKSNSNTAIALTVGTNGKVTQGASVGTTIGGTGTCTDGSSTSANNDCTGGTDDTLDCKGGPFNWLVCPAILLMSKAVATIDTFIMNTLDIDVVPIFDQTDQKGSLSNGYYTAWSAFRVLATAFLVIAGLVMVTSQALGFEFLDAYTIRKVLPRLLIAVIGISLSWPLMRFVVSFFDTLGFDVRSLIYAPFSALNHELSITGGVITTLGVGAAIFLLGPASLTIILSALLSVFVGFVVLVLREIAIIMLIILAPIGIAAFILPNTQSVWKLWHENFLGLLMAFPAVSALIAAGHVFAAIATSTKSATSSITMQAAGVITDVTGFGFAQTMAAATGAAGTLVAQCAALIGDYGPPFFIGTVIMKLNGAVSTLIGGSAGFFNGAAKMLSDKRGEAASRNWNAMKNQSRWDNGSALGRFGNTVGTWATDPVNNAAYYGRNLPGFRKRGSAVASHLEHAKVDQSAKLFEELNKAGYNDKSYRALSGAFGVRGKDMSEQTYDRLTAAGFNAGAGGRAPRNIKELEQMSSIMAQGSASEQIASNAIHGSMGRLATLYQDPEMNKASLAAAGTMGLAAHGFASSHDLADAGNSLKGELNSAYAQSVVSQSQLMGARSRPDVKNGYGVMYNAKSGEFVSGMTEKGGYSRDLALIGSLNANDVAGAKSGFLKDEGIQKAYEDVLVKSQTADAKRQITEYRNLERDSPDRLKHIATYGTEAQKKAVKDAKRMSDADKIHTAVKDQLFQWAGPYSHASGDIKAGAFDMLNKYGLRDEFDSYKTRASDPATRGDGAPGGGGDEA